MKFSDYVKRKHAEENGDAKFSVRHGIITLNGDKKTAKFSVEDWEQMLETIDGGVTHAKCGKYTVAREGDGLMFSLEDSPVIVLTSTEVGTMKMKIRAASKVQESAVDDLADVEGAREPKTLATAGGLKVIHYFDDDSVRIIDKAGKIQFKCPYPVWTQLR